MWRELIIAVVVGGAAFGLGRFSVGGPASSDTASPDEARDGPAPAATSPRTDDARSSAGTMPPDDAGSLGLLRRCTRRLESVRARLRLQQAGRRDDPAHEGAVEVDAAACLDDDAVRRACGLAPLGADDGDEPSRDSAGSPAAGARGAVFAHRFTRQVVGVSEGEAQWMEEYLCAVHDLREQMIEDLDGLLTSAGAPEEIDALLEEARGERKTVLQDLEQRLGPERYARLRSVGGLGVLGASLPCES